MKAVGRTARETDLASDDPSVVLSSSRTTLSFERTRMGADRTLMAIVRTSLSLIGFGFTIHTVFDKLAEAGTLPLNPNSAQNFGLALISIGVLLLALGIVSHRKFQRELTERREALFEMKLLRRAYSYSATPTFVTALALLFVGLAAIAVVLFNMISDMQAAG